MINAVVDVDDDPKQATSIYDFTVKDTYGHDVPLDQYRGNVVLIVNIASQCSLTKLNYEKLTELNKKYYDKGLRILAFPSDQFAQMPESDGDKIMDHLHKSKADIGEIFKKVWINGRHTTPLYVYLKHQKGDVFGNSIKWNFTKFLINKNGQVIARFGPSKDPMELDRLIDKLLKQQK